MSATIFLHPTICGDCTAINALTARTNTVAVITRRNVVLVKKPNFRQRKPQRVNWRNWFINTPDGAA